MRFMRVLCAAFCAACTVGAGAAEMTQATKASPTTPQTAATADEARKFADDAEVQNAIKTAKEKIISGEIKVKTS